MSLVPSSWFPRWRRAAGQGSEGIFAEGRSPLCHHTHVSGETTPELQTHCIVVLIGFQTELTLLVQGAHEAVDVAQVLAGAAQAMGVRVVALEIDPGRWGPTVACVRYRCDAIVERTGLDTFDSSLMDSISEDIAKPGHIVLAGCEAHTGLLQVACMAMDLGCEVSVVQEACASRNAEDAAHAMQMLRRVGAKFGSAADVIRGWCQCTKNQKLDALLQLVERTAAGGSHRWR